MSAAPGSADHPGVAAAAATAAGQDRSDHLDVPFHSVGSAVEGGLIGLEDAYDGLIISPDTLPSTCEEFTTALDASLPAWREVRWVGCAC